MSIGLIGKKIGMTREFFDTGISIPVTVLSIEKGTTRASKGLLLSEALISSLSAILTFGANCIASFIIEGRT